MSSIRGRSQTSRPPRYVGRYRLVITRLRLMVGLWLRWNAKVWRIWWGTLTGGKLRYLLADLASVPRAALVVEDRWSQVFKLERVRPSIVADGLAEMMVRFPTVPIVFAETRPLAQEWVYRFFGAALAQHGEHEAGAVLEASLPAAPLLAPAEPTVADVRVWARQSGLVVPDRGRLRPEVWAAFRDAQTH
jgi:hypothetical protein